MNRLTSIVMLFCFVARQFDCCSDSCHETACREFQQVALAVSGAAISNVEAGESGCHCHHGDALSPGDSACDRLSADIESDHSHPRHLCVADHLVYTNASRLPTQTMQSGIVISFADQLVQSAVQLRTVCDGVDFHPPRFCSPVRAQLGVYRV